MQATRLISRKERKKLMDCGAEVCRNVTPERFFSPGWGIADGYPRRRKEAAERQPHGKACLRLYGEEQNHIVDGDSGECDDFRPGRRGRI